MASARFASRLARATRPSSTPQILRQQARRGFASSTKASNANASILLGAGAATFASASAAYLFFQKDVHAEKPKHVGIEADAVRAEKEALDTEDIKLVPHAEDYQRVYNAIAKRLHEVDDYDDGSYGPVLLRLGWHASGTYDAETKTGGSNGATMRFDPERDHGANAGLTHARDFLEPIKKQFPWLTYSDLWTLAAVCSIQEMQGPIVPWRPGRSDRDESWCTPDGRLPDGSKGQDHLRAIFGRMGFNDQEIVALSGAHALGRCHTDRSGFDGPWTHSPTVVTNDYFRLLLEPDEWNFRAWKGPKQYQDKSSGSLMMLPTDMALVKDKSFKTYVEQYAKDNDKFFEDFSNVLCKLFELGVPFESTPDSRLKLKVLE